MRGNTHVIAFVFAALLSSSYSGPDSIDRTASPNIPAGRDDGSYVDGRAEVVSVRAATLCRMGRRLCRSTQ